jgi:hypothetical protein
MMGCSVKGERIPLRRKGVFCTDIKRTGVEWVVIACYFKEFVFRLVHFTIEFMSITLNSLFGLQYFTLDVVKPYARDVDPPMTFPIWMTQVKMDKLSHNNALSQFNIHFGKLDQFFFEWARSWWLENTPFVEYPPKLGR